MAAFFIAAAVAMTWPLALHLPYAAHDPGDPFFTSWTIDWCHYATFGKAPLFDANIFHPSKNALAFSEHTWGVAFWFFPLLSLGVTALTVHNLALLLGFAGCGYASYLLARSVTGATTASLLAGVAYAFVGFRFHHLPHLTYVWSMWLPAILLALLLFARKPTWTRITLLAITVVLNGLTSMHWLVFGSTALTLAAVVLGVTGRRDWRYWAGLAAAGIVAIALLLPFILPYRDVAMEQWSARREADAIPTSAEWSDWLQPNYQNRLYGEHSPRQAWGHERTLFPGAIVALLAIGGAIAAPKLAPAAWRPALWALYTWLLLGVLGARGLRGILHTLLFESIAPLRGIRMPVRWVMIAYVAIAAFAAIGAHFLLRRLPRIPRMIAGSLLIALTLFEMRVAPIRWYLTPLDRSPVYAWLATVPLSGAVAELPMTQRHAYEYLWHATVHHQPLINGVSSYTPPQYERFASRYDASPIPDAWLDELEARRCALLIVHQALLRERSSDVRAWLQRAIASGRLAFVRRFATGTHGDYVFALTRVQSDSVRWSAPETPDPSGLTPSVTLQRFLEDDAPGYTTDILGNLDQGPLGTFRGTVTIKGWALAPEGIAEVNLHFANRRVKVRADRHDRSDLFTVFPWYPRIENPGFAKTFEAPLDGIDGDTDLQIEIVSKTGRRRWLNPLWFRWYPPMTSVPAWNRESLSALLTRLGPDAVAAEERVIAGSATVADFTASLLTDREEEPDSAFVTRIYRILIGRDADPASRERYERMLARRTSRERLIEKILESREFAETHFRK